MSSSDGKRRERAEEILDRWLVLQMDGQAPAKEDFLASNEDLRDLLEVMLENLDFAQEVLDLRASKGSGDRAEDTARSERGSCACG
jgi:hypothetical protein